MPDVTLTPAEAILLFLAGLATGVVLCVLATWVADLIERLTGWLTEPPPTTPKREHEMNENQWQRPAGEPVAPPPQQPAPKWKEWLSELEPKKLIRIALFAAALLGWDVFARAPQIERAVEKANESQQKFDRLEELLRDYLKAADRTDAAVKRIESELKAPPLPPAINR